MPAKLKKELPGIFLWSVKGLRRLREQQRFTEPQVCKDAVAEYKLESNPAKMFLLEHCEAISSERIGCTVLYEAYTEWCGKNGFKALGERQFGKEVNRGFPDVKRERESRVLNGGRPYYYQGLKYVPARAINEFALLKSQAQSW